jgi:NAD(P)-dependent dehydrogenase (short-subunit alcohol dehydrogenase family)
MVNHLAPFILSYRLVPLLKSNAPARIVNVIAKQYVRGKIDLERTPFGHDFSRVGTYANTKLCNLITTIQLANRLSRSGVTVNAVHPGVSQTELGNPSGFLGTLFRLAKRSLPSPAEGARAPVWLATSPDVVGINGQYFEMLKATEVEENARDDLLGRNLWDLSVNLAGLDSGSPH